MLRVSVRVLAVTPFTIGGEVMTTKRTDAMSKRIAADIPDDKAQEAARARTFGLRMQAYHRKLKRWNKTKIGPPPAKPKYGE